MQAHSRSTVPEPRTGGVRRAHASGRFHGWWAIAAVALLAVAAAAAYSIVLLLVVD